MASAGIDIAECSAELAAVITPHITTATRNARLAE